MGNLSDADDDDRQDGQRLTGEEAAAKLKERIITRARQAIGDVTDLARSNSRRSRSRCAAASASR
jgi:hypothetical protein